MNQNQNFTSNLNLFPEIGTHGSRGKQYGGNNITMRGTEIFEGLTTGRPSKNIIQAHFKALRFYRKVCRLIPFLLRIHDLEVTCNSQQAMLNVANIFRKRAYLRDPDAVDRWVYRGYELLYQAEWHMLNRDHLFQYFSNQNRSDAGYSYLENQKLNGKSEFLKDFYIGNKTYEY
ncbi:unnamed protein product [Paramecium sonneborni]|uniref:Uncharacterized protein n=1 Tax=Paramecium sonneborni TaxID=65129 RepID=A0A8S1KIZ9_9CILI|nr:unnamed protein product [Paramecium sonneborni]